MSRKTADDSAQRSFQEAQQALRENSASLTLAEAIRLNKSNLDEDTSRTTRKQTRTAVKDITNTFNEKVKKAKIDQIIMEMKRVPPSEYSTPTSGSALFEQGPEVSHSMFRRTSSMQAPPLPTTEEASVGMKRRSSSDFTESLSRLPTWEKKGVDDEEKVRRLQMKHDAQNAAKGVSPTEVAAALSQCDKAMSSLPASPLASVVSPTAVSFPCRPFVSASDRKQERIRIAMQSLASDDTIDTATQLRRVNSFDNTSSNGPIVFKSQRGEAKAAVGRLPQHKSSSKD